MKKIILETVLLSLMSCVDVDAVTNASNQTENENQNTQSSNDSQESPDEIIRGECKDLGLWQTINHSTAPSPRYNPSASLDGSQMMIFGGVNRNDGKLYNPLADTWSTMTSVGAPSERSEHSAVQFGTKTIIWGGYSPDGARGDGAIYDSTTQTWSPMSNINAPSPRYDHAAVAIRGNRMLIWGGLGNGYRNDGSIYNLDTDTWTAISNTNAPSARELRSSSIWTGKELIVWGGLANSTAIGTGAMYNPDTNTWTTMSETNAPLARFDHSTVWTGKQMIVWGGGNTAYFQPFVHLNDGAAFDPSQNKWTPISNEHAPSARIFHSAAYIGARMFIFGGSYQQYDNHIVAYDPASDTWSEPCEINALEGRHKAVAVTTDKQLILWGGDNGIDMVNDGIIFTPSTK